MYITVGILNQELRPAATNAAIDPVVDGQMVDAVLFVPENFWVRRVTHQVKIAVYLSEVRLDLQIGFKVCGEADINTAADGTKSHW